MKCHILFSEKNKKNISKCRLLKILPRVLSVKLYSLRKRSSWRRFEPNRLSFKKDIVVYILCICEHGHCHFEYLIRD